MWKPWHFWGRKQNKTMRILFISHSELFFLVLRSLKKTLVHFWLSTYCPVHPIYLKYLCFQLKQVCVLQFLVQTQLLLGVHLTQWGWISTEGTETTSAYIKGPCLRMTVFVLRHHIMLFLILLHSKLPFCGSKLFGYCYFKSVCGFTVSDR